MQHPTLIVDHNLVGELAGLGEIVRDDDGRLAEAAERRLQIVPEAPAERAVERGKRLVQQDEIRIHRKRPAEGHPLLLSA